MRKALYAAALLLVLPTLARASVNDALDALYQSGKTLKSLAADVTLVTTSGDTGDEVTKRGRFVMQKLPDGDTRARATFTQRQSGKKIFNEKHDYLMAGPDLIDRDYAAKKQVTRQMRKSGEKIDLFKLGEGPFPLPIGQPPADVLKQFDVTEEKNADPAVLAVLTLSPKANTPLADKFKWIRVTIDKANKLPRVVVTTDKQEVDTNTATLSNVRVDNAVKDDEFKLESINEKEWTLVSS